MTTMTPMTPVERIPMIARSFALLLAAAPLAAQASTSRAADFRWEKAIAAGSTVSLHNLNGNVTVSPSTSGKVEVVGVKRGRYADDVTLEVVETSRGVMVCAMFKSKDVTCDEDGYQVHDDRRYGRRRNDDWDDSQIDIVVKVPRDLRVNANSVSGDVEITGAEGSVRAGSVSGNVRLDKLRATTALRASSVSGDVWVVVESLAGEGELRFTSVSGNVTAELPKSIDADVRMRSVSGSLDSDFPLTLNGRMSRSSLEARIGKGGRQLEVTTVSGDVRLRAARQ
jgi:DUF4097 and DUF4098 domain-containing protein YvlB